MSSPREWTGFCRRYYYLAVALSRINSTLKVKLLKRNEQKECTKSDACLWLNDVKINSQNMKTSVNQPAMYLCD